ncbi:MAG TPA: hypothetical protein VEY69_15660, partial [Lautropia sp.]|nr:hypothetical protein [Lautropia sp.]
MKRAFAPAAPDWMPTCVRRLSGLDLITNPVVGDADADMALAQGPTTAQDVVGLAGVELAWLLVALPIGLPHGRDRIQHLFTDERVVAVGGARQSDQGQPCALGQDVPFGAGFAPIRRV